MISSIKPSLYPVSFPIRRKCPFCLEATAFCTSNHTLTTCYSALELFVWTDISIPCWNEQLWEFKDSDLFKLLFLYSWWACSQRTWNSASLKNAAGSRVRQCKGSYISNALSKSKAPPLVFWTVRVWQVTPVFLPGESPWTDGPGGL